MHTYMETMASDLIPNSILILHFEVNTERLLDCIYEWLELGHSL